jgi:pimeloyl-ACP methyl ester carboxylesterase
VLLPGLDGTGLLFRPFIQAAPSGWCCDVIRYPDRSDWIYHDYAAFVLDHLPAGEHLLLGESFSGPVATLVAAGRRPGLLGMVLCCSFVLRPAWRGLRYLPWSWLLDRAEPPVALAALLGGRRMAGQVAESIAEAGCLVRAETRAARMREVLKVDVRGCLEGSDVPLLDLRGSQDRLVPSRCGRHVLRARPDAMVLRVAGPHLLLQVAPEACWRAIEAFAQAARCSGRGS